jgi:murein DD-endopeptidase MepM/ murein hydrolase activator NlpD
MLKQLLAIHILIFGVVSCLTAQNIDDWILANEKNPVEKIYIHTDAENYFTGDTVWFKIYLTDSRSGQLIPRAENVYVNLLDGSGTSAIQQVLLCANGQASGSFTVSDKMKPGNYLLQAYTNYLFNFSPDSYFYKQIAISRISGSARASAKIDRTANMVADVAFMPEGGVLLGNTTNLVAFKAIGKLGYGVNARGTVKDEKGSVVATFKTDYRGMGLLFLTPEPGKSYFATIEGFPSFRYKFEPVTDGIKIQLVNHTTKEVILNIASNSESLSEENFYIANMHRGEVLFYQAFKMDGSNKLFKFENSALKPGINRLILLDKTLKPVSERLLFSRNTNINNLVVQPDNEVFKTRQEISIQINDEKYLAENDFSNLSVSVVHEFVIPESGFVKNILSQFLIDSELNGYVESSADLFTDNELSSETKLRLVMLTNGYTSYFWNSTPDKTAELKFKQEAGISLKGVAKNMLTGNVIDNGEITLAIQKDSEVAFLTQKTDSLGRFDLTGLLFNDTATIHVQAKTNTGKMNVDVFVEPVFRSADASESQTKQLGERTSELSQLANLKYQIYNENRKFQPKGQSVRTTKSNQNNIEADGHFRLYESADFVMQVGEFEQSFDNVLDYMVGKIPGVDINGNDIRIRGASSFGTSATPLFLLDGIPMVGMQSINLPQEVSQSTDAEGNPKTESNEQLIQTVRAIPMSDVDKIEVLKSAHNTAVFGLKGANGVIAIYTRRGKMGEGSSIGKGIIENKVVGYSKHREFYSPKYTPQNLKDKKPDLRTLLYWNPEVITKGGNTKLKFFSSDQPGKYHIIVEGIASDGRICLGQGDFRVE